MKGLTAIEAWVIACIIFVFGALGEYTVILLKIKLKKIQRKPSTAQASPASRYSTTSAWLAFFTPAKDMGDTSQRLNKVGTFNEEG